MGVRPLTCDILLPNLCDQAAAQFVQQLTRCQAENPQERMLFHVFRSAAAFNLRTCCPFRVEHAVQLNNIGPFANDLCSCHLRKLPEVVLVMMPVLQN